MATAKVDHCSLPQIPVECSKKSGVLTDRDVKVIAERKLGTGNFCLTRWSLEELGEANGFLGQYYHLFVDVCVDGTQKRLKFFTKMPPPTQSPQYDLLVRRDSFNKEMIFYDEIKSRMGTSGDKWAVDFYFAKKNAIIVLEDATISGYRSPDKYVPLDKDHCIALLMALSRLHARSLILDEKLRRNTGKTLCDFYRQLLDEVLFADGDEMSEKVKNSGLCGVFAMIDLTEELTEDDRVVLKNRVRRWTKAMAKLLDPSRKYRNVLCHRDTWANNLMFKDDPAGKPVGCYLIDFQFLRYSPPAIDFMNCLHLTTSRKVREENLECFMSVYYNTFKQELTSENLSVEECLPWKLFRASVEEAKQTAVIYAALNLQVMLLTKEAVNEYFVETEKLEKVLYGEQRADLVRHQFETSKEYKARLVEVILEIRESVPDNPPDL